MKIVLRKFINTLLNLDLFSRRIILFVADIFCFLLAFIVTNWFFNTSILDYNFFKFFWIFPLIIIIGIPFYLYTGQYKEITRYSRSLFSYKLLRRNLILISLIFFIGSLFKFEVPSVRFFCLFWFLLSTFIGEVRLLIRGLVQNLRREYPYKKSVAIYGAGVAGSQLATSLKFDKSMNVLTFIDDDDQLWGRTIEGISICSFNKMKENIPKLDLVLIAMPSI